METYWMVNCEKMMLLFFKHAKQHAPVLLGYVIVY